MVRGALIRAGNVQALSAERGIQHFEYNDSKALLGILKFELLPCRGGINRRWATKSFAETQRAGRFILVASGLAEHEDTLKIDADAQVLGATVGAGQRVAYPLPSTRYVYFVPDRGRVLVNNRRVGERDGIAIAGESGIAFIALKPAEIILVDAV